MRLLRAVILALALCTLASATAVCQIGQTNVGGDCVSCEQGKYKDFDGNQSCTNCTGNSTSAGGSVAITACKCNAGYSGNANVSTGLCTACLAGYYKNEVNNIVCTQCTGNSTSAVGSVEMTACKCNAGFSGNAGTTGQCSACDAGKYKDVVANEILCTDCTGDSNSDPGSNEKADCKCKAGFSGDAGVGNCTACLAGKYKTLDSNTNCTACAGNSTTSAGGSVEIAACKCNAGYSGNANVSTGLCTACLAGYYKSEVNNIVCTQCTGNSTSAVGSVAITACKCNAGYSGNAHESTGVCTACLAGYYKDVVNNSVCTQCNGNSTSAVGSDAITDCKCNAGFSGTAAAGQCTACLAGKYKFEVNNTACTDCPEYSISEEQSVARIACECNAGYSGDAAVHQCTVCAAGKFKAVGNGSCMDCAGNSTTSAEGSDSIEDCQCKPGYSGNASVTGGVCTACDAGRYKAAGVNAECKDCEAGKYQVARGSILCTPCGAGKFGNLTKQASEEASCTACTANATAAEGSVSITDCKCKAGYSGNADQTGGNCTACSAGKFKAEGNKNCTDCEAGTYGVAVGSAQCTECGAGKYGVATAQTACTACTANSTSAGGSDSIADCKCNAGFSGNASAINGTCTPVAPSVAPLPVAPKDTLFFLILIISMPMTRAEFYAAEALFKVAIAAAAGINPDNVDILTVTDSRRRAGSVDVETKLRATDDAALTALAANLGEGSAMLSKINAELAKRGLPLSTGVKTVVKKTDDVPVTAIVLGVVLPVICLGVAAVVLWNRAKGGQADEGVNVAVPRAEEVVPEMAPPTLVYLAPVTGPGTASTFRNAPTAGSDTGFVHFGKC